ncbi:MAG: ribonuclease HII [Bacteroidia bacterium]
MKLEPLKAFLNEGVTEAGVDEAGRGCLAGPVVAAAVILKPDYRSNVLNDSKKLNEKTRNQLREEIIQNCLAWAVGIASVEEIDKINILNASFLAMHRAIAQLNMQPKHLLIDGNRFKPYEGIPHNCIIGGDGKYLSIAAASVLAKTTRDSLMKELHAEFPAYGWDVNKGYGTLQHRESIRLQGANIHHRKSFRLLPEQLSLFDNN